MTIVDFEKKKLAEKNNVLETKQGKKTIFRLSKFYINDPRKI